MVEIDQHPKYDFYRNNSRSVSVLNIYFAEFGALGGVEISVTNLTEAFIRKGFKAGLVEMTHAWKSKRILNSQIPVWGVMASSWPSYTAVHVPGHLFAAVVGNY